jgi:tellurite resistance protein TerC
VASACLGLGLAFGAALWWLHGPESARQYVSGYLVELSLSVDNVLVFALVFERLSLDAAGQRRTLFWGIAGAVVLRTLFITAGLGAIRRFAWLAPLLGLVLLLAGLRAALSRRGAAAFDPSAGPMAFLARRLPAWLAALAIVEAADLVFALDSLPAVMAVTHDTVVAVSSNLFAILGLRSLYFVVRRAVGGLRHLRVGIAAVLALVGAKMVAEPWYPVPSLVTLPVIAGVLLVSILASLPARAPR